MGSIFLCSLKPKEAFHFPPCSVACLLSQSSGIPDRYPKRRRGGANGSFKSHCERWMVFFPDSLLFCFPSAHRAMIWPSQSTQFTAMSPVQLVRQTTQHNTPLNPGGWSGSLKINFTKIKTSESEKVIYDKVNM